MKSWFDWFQTEAEMAAIQQSLKRSFQTLQSNEWVNKREKQINMYWFSVSETKFRRKLQMFSSWKWSCRESWIIFQSCVYIWFVSTQKIIIEYWERAVCHFTAPSVRFITSNLDAVRKVYFLSVSLLLNFWLTKMNAGAIKESNLSYRGAQI